MATVALLAGPGCASDKFTFSRYSGSPQEWPTERESMAEDGKRYGVPVFRTWPDKPYEVLGSIRHKIAYRRWNDGAIREVSKLAKKEGGDAMVLRIGSEYAVAGVAGGERQPGTRNRQAMTALVVKWLSAEDIARRQADADAQRKQTSALWQDWHFRHPSAVFSDDAMEVAVKYLAGSGASPASPEFRTRLDGLLDRISKRTGDGFAGEWVCKAHVKSGGLASSTERDYFGIVQVEQAGQRVTGISREGNMELTFSGSVKDGSVEGDLGLAGIAAKATGVATSEKITVTFLATLPNGTAQGTVSFQRAAVKK